MNKTGFTIRELESLCRLYIDGLLDRGEEKALRHLLAEAASADSPLCRRTLALMEAERLIATPAKRPKARKSTWRAVGASLLIAAMALPFAFRPGASTADAEGEEMFVVWRDGQRITGDEARRIAEREEHIDMEMMRMVLRKQREMLKVTYASIDAASFD